MKRYTQFLKEEVGMRNLRTITDGTSKSAEIYFHKDLDGVTSAIAIKEFFLNFYGIKTVDCHIIQYGGLEFAVKNKKPGNLAILVDFAHAKPMFTIATDHHDKQAGGKDVDSSYFKRARSNVETISGEISYSDVFTPMDVELIKTIDSADFFRIGITPEDVQNSIFQYKRNDSAEKNRFMMGFVVNRLLLAYKNKRITVKSLDGRLDHINRNILECLVLDSNASLYSIFGNIRHYINNARTHDKAGTLAKPEDIAKNLRDYIERMREYQFVETSDGEFQEFNPKNPKHLGLLKTGQKIPKGVTYDDKYKLIFQYGGGSMIKPGSYDRYVPFKNHPEADFLCIVWPMGLIQVSCNPFKNKKLLQVVRNADGEEVESVLDLGEISKEVLAKYQKTLSRFYVSLNDVKYEYEQSSDWKKMAKEEGEGYEGVGFRYSDLMAFYSNCVYEKIEVEGEKPKLEKYVPGATASVRKEEILQVLMNTVYTRLSEEQKEYLKAYKISVWEIITRNSGGHTAITNIQGLNFLKYNKPALRMAFNTEKYTDVLKRVAKDFIDDLKTKIDVLEKGKPLQYDASGVELSGFDTNENFDYFIITKNGKEEKVNISDFTKAGFSKKMKLDLKNTTIDLTNKKVVAKFEGKELSKKKA